MKKHWWKAHFSRFWLTVWEFGGKNVVVNYINSEGNAKVFPLDDELIMKDALLANDHAEDLHMHSNRPMLDLGMQWWEQHTWKMFC